MACSAGSRTSRPAMLAIKSLRTQSSGPGADPGGDRIADFLRLVPDVAGQGLVGPFAGQRDLVSLLVNRLRQRNRAAHEVSSTGPSAARIKSGKRAGDVPTDPW